MARQAGIILLKGTLGGITFYETQDGFLARKSNGMDAHQLATNPAYERTRKNCNEFGYSVKMGHLLRKSVWSLVAQAKDPKLTSRLTQLMVQLKNLDTQSEHGSRKVSIGLQDEAGKQLLKGFNFNNESHFEYVFNGNYQLDPQTGSLILHNFNPLQNIRQVAGCTHMSIGAAMSVVDFETGMFNTTYSEKHSLSMTDATTRLVLTPSAVPTGNGVRLYYCLLAFFQEMNGIRYPLNKNAHNVLYVMEVL